MLKFNCGVAVAVCGHTQAERDRFVCLFERLMGYTTQTVRYGTYIREDNGQTDREPCVKVEVWTDDWVTIRKVLKLARWLQAANKQESVAIETVCGGRWSAYVVFGPEDWAELERELQGVFA